MVVDPATALKVSLTIVSGCVGVYKEISEVKKRYKSFGVRITSLHDGLKGQGHRLSTWKTIWEIGVGKPGEGTRYFGDGWEMIRGTLADIEKMSLQLVTLLAPLDIPSFEGSDESSQPTRKTYLSYLPAISLRPRTKKGKITKPPTKAVQAGQKYLVDLGKLGQERLVAQDERVAKVNRARFWKKLKQAISKDGKQMETLVIEIKAKLEELRNDSDKEYIRCHPHFEKGLSLDEIKRKVEESWDIGYATTFRNLVPSLFSALSQRRPLMDNLGLDLGGHHRASISQMTTYTFAVKKPSQPSSVEIQFRGLGPKKPSFDVPVGFPTESSQMYGPESKIIHISSQDPNSPSESLYAYRMTATEIEEEASKLANILPIMKSLDGTSNGSPLVSDIPQSKRLKVSDKWEIAFQIVDAGLLLLGMNAIPLLNPENLVVYRDKGDEMLVGRCCYDFRSSATSQHSLLPQIQQLQHQSKQVELQACSIGILLLELETELRVSNIKWRNEKVHITMSDGTVNDLEKCLADPRYEIGNTFRKTILQCFSNLSRPKLDEEESTPEEEVRKWLENFYQTTVRP
jgi:hypothetical protein